MLAAGTRIDGYRIESTLGQGATSTVYAATQLSLGRRVALKLLDRGAAFDPAGLERFSKESRLQAALDHPAILPVLEAGRCEHGMYLVTRLVEGPTLSELVLRAELPAARAMSILGQIADGLDFAHDAGFIHRDVKPHNVLVGPGDRAVLADFGLVRKVDEETFTLAGKVFGTVAYLAPEVIRGERATAASDRYAFAVLAFECLTGRTPFAHPAGAAVLYAHLSQAPPRLSEVRSALPRGLDGVFAKGLAKEPDRRPPTCRELVDAARERIGEELLARLTAPQPADVVQAPAAMTTRRHGRRRLAILGAGAGTLAAIGGAAVLLAAGGESTGVAAPAPPTQGIALGSDLSGDGTRSIGCDGDEPAPGSPACTVLQRHLPGSLLKAPRSGTIIGWSVRGASGILRPQVIRKVDGGYREVYGGQPRKVGGDGVVRFGANTRIERGDRVGVELAPGASIGVRTAEGATTVRWLTPLAPSLNPSKPTRGAGTGLDREVMLRVDMIPGRRASQPRHHVGEEARSFRLGDVLDTVEVELEGRLYEVRARERWLDMFLELVREDRRIAVVQLHDTYDDARLEPLHVVEENGGAHIYVETRNPGADLPDHYEFTVTPEGFELVA